MRGHARLQAGLARGAWERAGVACVATAGGLWGAGFGEVARDWDSAGDEGATAISEAPYALRPLMKAERRNVNQSEWVFVDCEAAGICEECAIEFNLPFIRCFLL